MLLLPFCLFWVVHGYDPLPSSDGCCSDSSVCTPCHVQFEQTGEKSLGGLVEDWLDTSKKSDVVAKYGPIEDWDVSQVHMMNRVFFKKTTFNADISKWAVHRVESFSQMFQEATAFNVDISGWNIGAARRMSSMFKDATSFTRALCGNTWLAAQANSDVQANSYVNKDQMFLNAGSAASIASESCGSWLCGKGFAKVTEENVVGWSGQWLGAQGMCRGNGGNMHHMHSLVSGALNVHGCRARCAAIAECRGVMNHLCTQLPCSYEAHAASAQDCNAFFDSPGYTAEQYAAWGFSGADGSGGQTGTGQINHIIMGHLTQYWCSAKDYGDARSNSGWKLQGNGQSGALADSNVGAACVGCTCVGCIAGKYGGPVFYDGIYVSGCLDCPAGYYSRHVGQSTCLQCATSKQSTLGSTSCYEFSYANTGTCGSLSGRIGISSKVLCQQAAESLSAGAFQKDLDVNDPTYPPGCFKNGDTQTLLSTLTTSTTVCGVDGYICLCMTGPLCSQTDGTTANSVHLCICGATGLGTACTSTTGLYCDSSSSTCSKRPPVTCSSTNGGVANNDDCKCGNSDCVVSSMAVYQEAGGVSDPSCLNRVGCAPITSTGECEQAAVSLGGLWDGHAVTYHSIPNSAPGCTLVNSHLDAASTSIWFNNHPSPTFTCRSANMKCACKCSAGLGLYCIASLNFCGKTCRLGEYRSVVTNGVCTKCPAGQFSDDASDMTKCKICPELKYQPNAGQTTCDQCVSGRYSSRGSTACPYVVTADSVLLTELPRPPAPTSFTTSSYQLSRVMPNGGALSYHQPHFAADGDPLTYWREKEGSKTNGDREPYWEVELSTSIIINRIEIDFHSSKQYIRRFKVLAANEGEFTVLASFGGQTESLQVNPVFGYSSSGAVTLAWSSDVAYDTYRLSFMLQQRQNSHPVLPEYLLEISEVRVYDSAAVVSGCPAGTGRHIASSPCQSLSASFCETHENQALANKPDGLVTSKGHVQSCTECAVYCDFDPANCDAWEISTRPWLLVDMVEGHICVDPWCGKCFGGPEKRWNSGSLGGSADHGDCHLYKFPVGYDLITLASHPTTDADSVVQTYRQQKIWGARNTLCASKETLDASRSSLKSSSLCEARNENQQPDVMDGSVPSKYVVSDGGTASSCDKCAEYCAAAPDKCDLWVLKTSNLEQLQPCDGGCGKCSGGGGNEWVSYAGAGTGACKLLKLNQPRDVTTIGKKPDYDVTQIQKNINQKQTIWGIRSEECSAISVCDVAVTTKPECQVCNVGQYNNKEGGSCKMCPKGKYGNSSQLISCLDCDVGQFSDQEGSVTCNFPTCTNTVGSVALTEDCQCGSAHCSVGLFCNTSSNRCDARPFKLCKGVSGFIAVPASESCKCGELDCQSGEYCVLNSDNNACRSVLALSCFPTNGLAPDRSNQNCQCGTTTCNQEVCVIDSTGSGTCHQNPTEKCEEPGHYPNPDKISNGSCIRMKNFGCPSGEEFSSLSGETKIKNGFTTYIGSTENDGQCTECRAGTFQGAEGSFYSCRVCSAGFYTNVSMSKRTCASCPAGKYMLGWVLGAREADPSKHDSIEDCKVCAVQEYNPFLGWAKPCYSCPTAKTTGSTACAGCNPGKFRDNNGNCNTCSAGKFSERQDSENCRACPSGWHAYTSGDGAVWYDRCEACVRGRFGTLDGATNPSDGCTNCTSGRYSADMGVGTASLCKGCQQGRWSNKIGADMESVCKFCGSGKYGPKVGASKETDCNACDAGRFNANVGSLESSDCKKCKKGKAGKLPAQAVCWACNGGKFASDSGQHECKECPASWYSKSGGGVNCSRCEAAETSISGSTFCSKCDAGKYMTTKKICSMCDAGQVATYGQAACTKCGAGHRADNEQSACNACKVAKYSSEAANIGCNDCERGQVSQSAQEKCTRCKVGYYVNDDSSSCIACVAGKHGITDLQSYDRVSEAAACQDCKVARYSSATGASSVDDCNACPPGKYSNVPRSTKSGDCKECEVGQYSNQGEQTNCKTCGAGQTSQNLGQTFCISCVAGRYMSVDKACTNCPVGWYRGNEDTACKKCEAGYFAEEEEQPFCRGCAAGTYSNEEGRNECSQCPDSTFTDAQRQTSCSPCPEGLISNEKATACLRPAWKIAADCDTNEYLDDASTDNMIHDCKPCVPGGNCHQETKWSNFLPLSGWWPIPTEYGPLTDRPFEQCPFVSSCTWEHVANVSDALDASDAANAKAAPGKCGGGAGDYDGVQCGCTDHSQGVLCSVCLVGYERDASRQCKACRVNEVGIRVALLCLFLVVLISGIWLCRKTLRRLHRKYSAAWKDVGMAVAIVINFCQINSSLPDMLSFDFPARYLSFLQRLDVVNIDFMALIGFQCVIDFDYRYVVLLALLIPTVTVSFAACAFYFHRSAMHASAQIMQSVVQPEVHRSMMRRMFHLIDDDANGFVDVLEFQFLVTALGGPPLSEKDATKVVRRAGGTKMGGGETWMLSEEKFLDASAPEMEDQEQANRALLKGLVSDTAAYKWIKMDEIWSTYCSGTVQFLLLFYAPVSSKAFFYFDCQSLGGRSYLRKDYNIECQGDKWWAFFPFALLLLVGFALLVPFALAVVLVRRRHVLERAATRSKLGFLYSRYQLHSFWWEIFELLRKMILCGALVHLPRTSRSAVALLVCALAIGFLNFYQPQRNRVVFWISQTSYCLTFLKYLVTVLSLNPDGGTGLTQEDSNTLGTVLIFLDVFMIVGTLLCLVAIFYFVGTSLRQIAGKEQEVLAKGSKKKNQSREKKRREKSGDEDTSTTPTDDVYDALFDDNDVRVPVEKVVIKEKTKLMFIPFQQKKHNNKTSVVPKSKAKAKRSLGMRMGRTRSVMDRAVDHNKVVQAQDSHYQTRDALLKRSEQNRKASKGRLEQRRKRQLAAGSRNVKEQHSTNTQGAQKVIPPAPPAEQRRGGNSRLMSMAKMRLKLKNARENFESKQQLEKDKKTHEMEEEEEDDDDISFFADD